MILEPQQLGIYCKRFWKPNFKLFKKHRLWSRFALNFWKKPEFRKGKIFEITENKKY
jgi:hypothetical protein